MNKYQQESTTDGSNSFLDSKVSAKSYHSEQSQDRIALRQASGFSSQTGFGPRKAVQRVLKTSGYAGNGASMKADQRGYYFHQPQKSEASQQVNFDGQQPMERSLDDFDHYQTQQRLLQQDHSVTPDLSKLSFLLDQSSAGLDARVQLNKSTAVVGNDITRSSQQLLNFLVNQPSQGSAPSRQQVLLQQQIAPQSSSIKREAKEESTNTRSLSAASQYYQQAKQLSRMRKNLRSQQSFLSQKNAMNSKPRTVIQRKLQDFIKKEQLSALKQDNENMNLTNMRDSDYSRIQMTHSMYKQQQERHFEKLGVQSNIRPQSKSSKMYLVVDKGAEAGMAQQILDGEGRRTVTRNEGFRREIIKTANSQLMLNNQSRNASFVIKQNSQKGGYIQLQTNVDGTQAIIPMILTSDMDILLRTQSSENELSSIAKNKSGSSIILRQNSSDDVVRKQTVLSRQGAAPGPIGQMSPSQLQGEMMRQQLFQQQQQDNITSTGRTGTVYMSQNVRMQPKGLLIKQESTDREDEDIQNLQNGVYSYELGTKRAIDDKMHNSFYQNNGRKLNPAAVTQNAFYNSYNNTKSHAQNYRMTQSPESSSVGGSYQAKLNRWSSRREGDPKVTSLTDILITDQNARKNSSGAKMISSGDVRSSAKQTQEYKASPMKPAVKQPSSNGHSRPRTNNQMKTRNKARQYFSTQQNQQHSQVASKVFPVQALIPDYEEVKTKAIVDTYKKILTRQSEVEGRSQPVTVAFNEEKFFFDAGINQPLFIGKVKKNPGFNAQTNQQAVINKRSCIGVKMAQEAKQREAEMRQTGKIAQMKNKQQSFEKHPHMSYLENNHYGEQELYKDFSGGCEDTDTQVSPSGNSPFNHYHQQKMLPQNWTQDHSSPALLQTHLERLSDMKSPYKSPENRPQQRTFGSQKQSEGHIETTYSNREDEGSQNHTRQITLSAYPQIALKQYGSGSELHQQDSFSRNQNKIIYSINKSTKQQTSIVRQNKQHGTYLEGGQNELRGYKSIEYRNIEGAMNIKSLNPPQQRSTLSSNHNLIQRDPHAGSNLVLVQDSNANSSILVSQEHLEPRPQLLIPRGVANQDNRSIIASSAGQKHGPPANPVISMQRIELRLTRKQQPSIDPNQFEDDERVIMRESYMSYSQVRDSRSNNNHQKNKMSSVSMKRSQNLEASILDSSARKKKASINQDLAGIKVPKKEPVSKKIQHFPDIHDERIKEEEGKLVENQASLNRVMTSSSAKVDRYATLRAQKIETMTNIMKARCKSAKTNVTIPTINKYLIDEDKAMHLKVDLKNDGGFVDLREHPMRDDHFIINVFASHYNGEPEIGQIEAENQALIGKKNSHMLIAPLPMEMVPELNRRSSRNVISKLQGRSLTANSMRSLNNNNTTKSKPVFKEQNSFSQLALQPEFSSLPLLNEMENEIKISATTGGHDRAASVENLQLIPQQMIIKDQFSTPTNEDAKKSMITIESQLRKGSEIPNDGILLAAHYKKDSSIIDLGEGFQASDKEELKLPVLQMGKQASFAAGSEQTKQNPHIIPSTIAGPNHHRRRSSNNKDLSLIDGIVQDQSPKRTVLIRKSNGPHDNLKIMPNAMKEQHKEKTLTPNKQSKIPIKQSLKQQNGQEIKSQQIVALDEISRDQLEISEVSNQRNSFKMRKLTDLPRHGKVAPSVLKRNLLKMNQSKSNSRNVQNQSSRSNTNTQKEANQSILSATFHVMPVPPSRNLQDPRSKTTNNNFYYQGNSQYRSVSPVYFQHTEKMQKVIIQQCELAIDADQQRKQLALIRAFQAQNAQLRYLPEALSEPNFENSIVAPQPNSQLSPNHLKIPLPSFLVPTAHSNLSALHAIPVIQTILKSETQPEPEPTIQEPLDETNALSVIKQKGGDLFQETLSPANQMQDSATPVARQLQLMKVDDYKRNSVSSNKQAKLIKSSQRVRESREGQITPQNMQKSKEALEGISVVGQQIAVGKNVHTQRGANL